MATLNPNEPDQETPELRQLSELWKTLDASFKAQDAAQSRLAGLQGREAQLDASIDANRGEAFKAMRRFTPEGKFNETSKGQTAIELMIRSSGIKDAYNHETMTFVGGARESAHAYRARETQSIKEGLGRAFVAPAPDAGHRKMGETDDLNLSPLARANEQVNRAMLSRQELALDRAKGDPALRAEHDVEQHLFAFRQADQVTHLNAADRARQNGDKAPEFVSRAVASPKLIDRLMAAPARELEAFRNAADAPSQDAAQRGDFFDFSKKASREAVAGVGAGDDLKSNQALSSYSQALVGKLAIQESRQEVAKRGQDAREAQVKISTILEGKTRGAGRGIPQFDEKHFKHFSKLNPANPEDRALLAQAAEMMAHEAPARLPDALQAVSEGVAARQVAQAPATTAKTAIEAAPTVAPAQAERQKAAPQQASAETRDAAQTHSLGEGRDKTQTAGEAPSQKTYGKSTPEERARRAAQMEFLTSKGITSQSSEADARKAQEEFQERWKASRGATASTAATNAQTQERPAQHAQAARPAAPTHGRSR